MYCRFWLSTEGVNRESIAQWLGHRARCRISPPQSSGSSVRFCQSSVFLVFFSLKLHQWSVLANIANIINTPEKHFTRKHWTNALPNNTQKITRKHGKSYLLSTRRRAFTIRGREHEEKCNVAKRFTVDIFTERDRTFKVNPLVTLVFMYLTQKDVLPDSK